MNHTGFQAKKLIQLALPVLIAQTTQTMMGFTDTIMAGRVSAADMAAVAIGGSLWLPAILLFQGILVSFTPIYAHHHGANNEGEIQPLANQAAYIACLGALLIMIFMACAPWVLHLMDIEPKLFKLTIGYTNALLWGAPALMLYQVLRGCSEGISYTFPTMIIGFVGLAINIPANYIFIYGKFGLPVMGAAGCGVATSIVLWSMLVAMVLYISYHKKFAKLQLFNQFHKPHLTTMWEMTKLGFPIGMALFFEVSLFAVIALLLAPMGIIVVAGHQIALNFSSIVFMLPLSIGIAVSIRVGYYIGQDKMEISAKVTKIGIYLGLLLACFTAICTVIFRFDIAKLYNANPEVLALAGSLMLYAALYQLSDSIQVVAAGALRGYKDTRSAFYITLIAYWPIGMGVGYLLGHTNIITPAMGAQGYWCGLIAGLSSAAVMFAWRLRYIQKNNIKIEAIEDMSVLEQL